MALSSCKSVWFWIGINIVQVGFCLNWPDARLRMSKDMLYGGWVAWSHMTHPPRSKMRRWIKNANVVPIRVVINGISKFFFDPLIKIFLCLTWHHLLLRGPDVSTKQILSYFSSVFSISIFRRFWPPIIGSSLVLKPHVGIFLGLQNSSKPITWRPNVCAVYRVRPW
jgi:hypothetical protein